MTWHIFLVLVHVIGTILGAGAVTFAGVFYWFRKPGDQTTKLDGRFLQVTYGILRFGLVLLILSGFGFFLEFRLTERSLALYSPQLWAKMTIVLVIVVNALLSRWQRLPALLSHIISFVSWYAAVVLGVVRFHIAYSSYMIIYGLIIVVTYAITARLRTHYEKAK